MSSNLTLSVTGAAGAREEDQTSRREREGEEGQPDRKVSGAAESMVFSLLLVQLMLCEPG